MPQFDWDRMSEAERAAFNERRKRELAKMTNPGLWRCWVDLLDPDCTARVRRIQELLDRAVENTGADPDDAISIWYIMGAGHDPEKMAQGLSGTGQLFKVYSQEVLDEFIALGGNAECPPQDE